MKQQQRAKELVAKFKARSKKKATAKKSMTKIKERGNKQFGLGSFVDIEQAVGNIKMFFSSEIPPLNVIITGKADEAFPSGRVVQLFGNTDVGKTTIGCYAMRSAQAAGGYAALIDTESTLTRERVLSLGVDEDRLLCSEAHEVEEVFGHIDFLLGEFGTEPAVIFWDTIAASSTLSQRGRKPGEHRIAAHAAAMASGMRVITKKLAGTNTCLICCNQMKVGAIGQLFPTNRDKHAAIGGGAMKFHSSIIINLMHTKAYRDDTATKTTKEKGFISTATTIKNKMSPGVMAASLVFDQVNTGEFDIARSCLLTLQKWGGAKKGRVVLVETKGGKTHTEKSFIEMYNTQAKFRALVHRRLESTFVQRVRGVE